MNTHRFNALFFALFSGISGCGPGFATDTTTSATSATNGGTGSSGGVGGTADLPGVTFATTGCETVVSTEVPGAMGAFVGTYLPTSKGWSAEERWILYANSAWEELGGADCEVVWTGSAVEGDTGACTTCDVGLQATLVLDSSTCPEDISAGLDSFDGPRSSFRP